MGRIAVPVLVAFIAAGALAAAVRNDRADDERAHRRELVAQLERRITADARARVARHELKGPILDTRCLPFDGLDQDDLHTRRGRYSCVAVTSETARIYGGHPFIATLDYDTGASRFRLTTIPVWWGI